MFSLDSYPPWARIDNGAFCAANTRFVKVLFIILVSILFIVLATILSNLFIILKFILKFILTNLLLSLMQTNTLEALVTTELPSPIIG